MTPQGKQNRLPTHQKLKKLLCLMKTSETKYAFEQVIHEDSVADMAVKLNGLMEMGAEVYSNV